MRNKIKNSETSLPPVRIEKLVLGGAGLGFSGGPVFIPLTAPGDLVVPADVRRARGVIFAEPGKLIERSVFRTDPPCPWFGECGGCQWMHMDYDYQFHWKIAVALETLKRIGRIEIEAFDRVHQSPVQSGYRHRARLHVEGKDAGFFRRRSNTVIAWGRCLLLPDGLDSAIALLRSSIASGLLPERLLSFEAALSPVDGGLTLNWNLGRNSVTGNALKAIAEGVEKELSGAGLRVAGQVFLDVDGKKLFEKGSALKLRAGGTEIYASPGTFFQVNPWMNDILVERVMDRLKKCGTRSLLDLFCGNGNFSIPAARDGIKVEGVDSSIGGIRDAMAAGGDECRFQVGDVKRYLSDRKDPWDVVLVDPPRTGLTVPLIKELLSLKNSLLVYVSCEPATLARDLVMLTEGGYVLKNTELFDMFPQTSHMEVMAVLEKPKGAGLRARGAEKNV